jgi:septum formation protein
MTQEIILASGSAIRAQMLRNVGLSFTVQKPRVDEMAIMQALQAEGASPRDIADALAEAKALKISDKYPSAMVLGCDQVLACDDKIYTKADSQDQALDQLLSLAGKTHHLFAALVIYENGRPIWRHVGHARMTMRQVSRAMLTHYLQENWASVADSVGCYKIEQQGPRLFSQIEGDNFTIQGMPLIALLNYFALKGIIAS